MAKQTRKGSLAGKVGTAGKRAVNSHKADETAYDTGGGLPEGIEAGVAQLTECKFDVYKKGKNIGDYFFLASGVVVQPKEHSGIPIEGQRTQIGPEAICDTPNLTRKDVDEHLDWVLNEMRKLGVDTSELDIDSLEDAAAALKEEQPYFRFRTWKGTKATEGPYKDVEPRVNHVWTGVCDYEEGDEEDGDVVDDTDEDKEDTLPDEEEEKTLAELGEEADGDDEGAQTALSEKAEELEIDPNEYATWAEVVTAIEEAEEGGDEEEEEEEDDDEAPPEPEKEDVCRFKPPRKRKAIECEVTAVFSSKGTCNLKSLDDGKVFKNVPFDKLEEED